MKISIKEKRPCQSGMHIKRYGQTKQELVIFSQKLFDKHTASVPINCSGPETLNKR